MEKKLSEDHGRDVRHGVNPSPGKYGYSGVGAVVGATYPHQLTELRKSCLIPFLVPGYGAQGGGAKDVAGAFDGRGLGAIVTSLPGHSLCLEERGL